MASSPTSSPNNLDEVYDISFHAIVHTYSVPMLPYTSGYTSSLKLHLKT